MTFQTPATTPSKKNKIMKMGLVRSNQSAPHPMTPPTRTAETNSLPMRRPSDIAAEELPTTPSGRARKFLLAKRAIEELGLS